MKKFILLILLAFFTTTTTTLAQEVTATLNHEGQTTTFYGMDAFREAIKAAQDNDIITLSPGRFNATGYIGKDINNLTIIGAGMIADTINKRYPTILDRPEIRACEKMSFKNLQIIGGFYPTDNTYIFEKCHISDCYIQNCEIHLYNCIIDKLTHNYYKPAMVEALNSYIHIDIAGYDFMWERCLSALFTNCILSVEITYTGDYTSLNNFSFNNSIIIDKNNPSKQLFTNSVSAKNTLYIGPLSNPFNQGFTHNIWITSDDINTIFANTDTFQLTEEAQTKYVSDDGSQIGIYGGVLPFDPTPNNPYIKKCEVAPKTTPDGKLSVYIEVGGLE